MSNEYSRDEGLTREVYLHGLNMASGELVIGARKECENPLTISFTSKLIINVHYGELDPLESTP